MKRVQAVLSPQAKTTSGVTGQASANGQRIALQINVSAVSGTTPTMDCKVQWSNDGGTWFDSDVPDTFVQITGVKAVCKDFISKGQYARVAYTIGGTTPSFTFSVDAFALED